MNETYCKKIKVHILNEDYLPFPFFFNCLAIYFLRDEVLLTSKELVYLYISNSNEIIIEFDM